MIQFFLSRIVKWFTKLSWAQFDLIVTAVKSASDHWKKPPGLSKEEEAVVNGARARFVADMITATFPGFPAHIVNLLRELAVGWFIRTAKK